MAPSLRRMVVICEQEEVAVRMKDKENWVD